MIFGEADARDQSVVGFEVLHELDQVVHLLPELDVAVDRERQDVFVLGRADYVVDELAMHITALVHLGRGQVLHQQIAVVHPPQLAGVWPNQLLRLVAVGLLALLLVFFLLVFVVGILLDVLLLFRQDLVHTLY